MSWITELDCGSGTQTGATIIQQINNLTRLFESAIFMINDTTDFDINGLGEANTRWEGFALCNGQNGTIDLRSKFIVGLDTTDTDYDSVGKTGGQKEVTLTIAEMPTHNHEITLPQYVDNQASPGAGATFGASTGGGLRVTAGNAFGSANEGQGEAHENRPPYFVLAFAQKI